MRRVVRATTYPQAKMLKNTLKTLYLIAHFKKNPGAGPPDPLPRVGRSGERNQVKKLGAGMEMKLVETLYTPGFDILR